MSLDGPPRDVVLIVDVSESMERKSGDLQCAQPGDSVGKDVRGPVPAWGFDRRVLLAGDGVQRLIDPPTYDLGKVRAVLESIKPPRGASDLAAALAEAFRILERTENPGRDVIVLWDGQRFPWRPGETGRWDLLRSSFESG